MKGKNLQPRILSPAKLSFRFDEIKSFPDKQKLREFSTTKPALQQRNFSRQETRKDLSTKNKPKAIKKTVIGSYISITTLNVNGLNEPTKRHRLGGRMKTYAFYTFTYHITLLDPPNCM